MELNTTDAFAQSDDFLALLDPFYGLRHLELLKKIEYLKQIVFWTKIIPLDCLIAAHQVQTIEIYLETNNLPISNHLWMGKPEKIKILKAARWKEKFERLLQKHEITFGPGNVCDQIVNNLVCHIDTHLCSGDKGDWSDIGFGLKFLTSQQERQKYINLTKNIGESMFSICSLCLSDHRREDSVNLLFSIDGMKRCDPIKMIDMINHGFVDQFDFDKFIFCCKDTFKQIIADLRNNVELIEQHIFWLKIGNREDSMLKLIQFHKYKYCHVDLQTSNSRNEDVYIVWEKVFESLLEKYGLTISPGKALVYTIDGVGDIYVDQKINVHFCSGKNGNWTIDCGFGNLAITDRSSRKKIIALFDHIKNKNR